jgi:hypothetical protein
VRLFFESIDEWYERKMYEEDYYKAYEEDYYKGYEEDYYKGYREYLQKEREKEKLK